MKKILFLIFAALATWSLGAEIMVYEYDTQLAALTAAWQEVAADEG